MSIYVEKIIDLETNTETIRDYTQEEIAIVEAAKQKAEKEIQEATKDVAVKEAAKQALLDKLGITAEEAALLLG